MVQAQAAAINAGWLRSAEKVPSPNFDARPDGSVVELIVIHGISLPPGQFGNDFIDAFFQNQLDPEVDPYFESICGMQVSAHFLIHRDGKTKQYVSIDDRAWHCGESTFKNRARCNDFAVGIELEGTDAVAFTTEQYECLGDLIASIGQCYPQVTTNPVVGHSDIAPGRKTDPGPHFNWHLLRDQLDRCGYPGVCGVAQ